jgi:hypothetical protein
MQTTKLHFISRVALILAVAVMVACSWLRPLDSAANEQVDAGLKRALISFAAARALDGVISVAQGTEFTVQVIGGVTLAAGQILDPVHDLVEQFSDLMLTASIAMGIQKVLLSIGSHWLISLLFTITAVIWTALYFRQKQCPGWLSKLLVVLLMTRFAIPVVAIGTDLVFQKFMAQDYQSSQQGIATVSGLSDNLKQPTAAPPVHKSIFSKILHWGKPAPIQPQSATVPPPNRGALERIKEWFSQGTDLKSRLENLKQSSEEVTEKIIKLMVIFVLQTLVIPVALLWILYGLARGLFERPTKTLS